MKEYYSPFESPIEQDNETERQELRAFLDAYAHTEVTGEYGEKQVRDFTNEMGQAMDFMLEGTDRKTPEEILTPAEKNSRFARIVDEFDVDQLEICTSDKVAQAYFSRGSGEASWDFVDGGKGIIGKDNFRNYVDSPRGQFLNGRDLLVLAITAYNMHKRGISDPSEPVDGDMEKTITVEDYQRVRKDILASTAPAFIKHLALSDPKVQILENAQTESQSKEQPKEQQEFLGEIPELPGSYDEAETFCNNLKTNHLLERAKGPQGTFYACLKDGIEYTLRKNDDAAGVHGAWTITQKVPGKKPRKRVYPGTIIRL